MREILLGDAARDLWNSLRRVSLAGVLGWQDIRQRYRRSAVGPFWITLSMGIMIASIGLVFGQLFDAPMAEFLPFLAAGIILWTLIQTSLTEGCTSFIEGQAIIKQLPVPLFIHVMRVIWRNIIMLGHNLLILPVLFLLLGRPVTLTTFLFLPGLALATFLLAAAALALGIVSTRFRDLPTITASILQVLFYVTPIIWMPSLLPERAGTGFLDLNPLYHVLEITRGPLLGEIPPVESWLVVAALSVVTWFIAVGLFARYRTRIAFWL